MAVEYPRNAMARQASRESTDGSMNSYSSEGKSVSQHMHTTNSPLISYSLCQGFLEYLQPETVKLIPQTTSKQNLTTVLKY